ncbi:MAG: CPBP family intramembrane metalloprotease [Planctomycetes bacterium]|nr:CPBP family intramembrane metalloprotease [Planctomycetota bacterium]
MSVKIQRGMAPLAMPVEVIIVTAVATAAAVAVSGADSRVGRLQWLLAPCMWMAAALAPTMLRGRALVGIGLKATRICAALKQFARVALIVIPLLFCGVFLLRRWGIKPPLQPGPAGGGWGYWVIYQFAYVALAEELFFRGYVQTSIMDWLAQVAPGRLGLWGLAAILISSTLFSLAHVATVGSATAAIVFFPGLIFGWLRARTDSLLAPILLHATANVAYAIACAII